jgi:uncharacterized protein (DUF488 family)
MPSLMRAPHLYTFGYQGLDIEAFVARVKQAGMRWIVDVRELPLSRKKGFSKSAFREHLESVGIRYLHLTALGCPKHIRDQYRLDGDWAAYTRKFLAYLNTQRDTVKELATLARHSTVCLVCFEADYATCHRTFVARAAHREGAPVVRHLTAKTAVADLPVRRAA